MIETMTDSSIEDSRNMINEIESLGGAMECVKSGFQQRVIHESAWTHLQRVENGDELVVGVNSHVNEDDLDLRIGPRYGCRTKKGFRIVRDEEK